MARYLSTEEAADYISVECDMPMSKRTLEKWRSQMTGPDYWRVGARIMYRVEDIESWLESNIKKVSAVTGEAS